MRKYIDCREAPSESRCTVVISADSEGELMQAAVQHAVAVHKHADTPELRILLRQAMHDGEPPKHRLRNWWEESLSRLVPAERLPVVGRGFTRHRPRV
jgi:predicted small metal-binding protein